MIESPCIMSCFLSENLEYCVGCGRTIEQIKFWARFSDEKRKKVLEEAQRRKGKD